VLDVIDRQWPQNLEAEKAVLGSCFLGGYETFDEVKEIITIPEVFCNPANRIIWNGILSLQEKKMPIDQVTFIEQVKCLPEIGGIPYLVELINSVPTSSNARTYAEIIKEKYMLRQGISSCMNTIEELYNEKPAEDTITKSMIELSNICEGKQEEITPIKKICLETFETLEQQMEGKILPGLKTGFRDFDERTGGLSNGDLIVIAARPSMGKTTLALNIIDNISKESGKVLFFSCEMKKEEITKILLAKNAKIDSQFFKNPKYIKDKDWPMLSYSLGITSERKLFIDDTPGIKLSQLQNKARKFKAKNQDLCLIVVDYLQLMESDNKKHDDQQAVKHISKGLKMLARELDIPIIALSQLSRAVEGRADKRPMLSDLRESGAIEQDADMVAFLYREDYYNELAEIAGGSLTELIIRKYRTGPTGMIKLTYKKEISSFFDIEQHRTPPQRKGSYPDQRED
jgi:replicative DNA helicase